MRPVLHKYTRWLSGLRLAQTSPWPLVAVGLALIGAGLGWDLRRQYVESQQFEAQRLQDGAQLVAQAAVQRLAAASTLLTRLDTALTNNPVDAQASVTAISASATTRRALAMVGRVVRTPPRTRLATWKP